MRKLLVVVGVLGAIGCSNAKNETATGGTGTGTGGTTSTDTTGTSGTTASATSGSTGGTSGTVDAGPVGPANCGSPPASDALAMGGVVAGNNRFALELFGQLAPPDAGADNVFVAPYSVSTAMAMLYAGACGQTAPEIASVMHFPDDAGTLAQAVGALDCQMLADGAGPDGGHLVVVNGFFVDQGFGLSGDYQGLLQQDLGAEAQTVNFAGDPNGASNIINSWVSYQTGGLIPDLLPQGKVTTETVLVLVNAIDLVGTWQVGFPAATDGTFRLASGASVTTPMMSNVRMWAGYAAMSDHQVLELRTQSQIAVDFFLPDTDDGLPAVLAELSASGLDPDLSQLQNGEVDVQLPKLNLDYANDLKNPLMNLGMVAPFGDNADFCGIGPGLLVQFVQHEAALQLTEAGLHAAGATAVGVGTTGATGAPPPAVFHADHPFLLAIRDLNNGAVLFFGRVQDPTRH